LKTYFGSNTFDIGTGLGAGGDVNNDVIPDLVISFTPVFSSSKGFIRVFSGATFGILWEVQGDSTNSAFGGAIIAGDLNKDGFDDFVVAAPRATNGFTTNAGRIRAYSGKTGLLLWTSSFGQGSSRLGASLASTGDINNDGYPDVIVGNANSGVTADLVKVLSGKDAPIFGR